METRINELLGEIRRLEEELEDAVKTQEVRFRYQLEGTKVRFQESVRAAHRQLKVGALRWLSESQPRNIAAAPFIYFMLLPLAFLDLAITMYQFVCFPLYGIPKVRRSRFIAVDRHTLSYLNSIEKLNCVYCGYANGLIAYIREIAARTEQYWCPIKHARKILDPHRRYARFVDFGDSEDFEERVEKMRNALKESEDG